MSGKDSATDWLHSHSQYLQSQFPIHFAACEGDIEKLTALLASSDPADRSIEDDFFGWTPTHWAAYFGQLACLRKLSLISAPNGNLRCASSQSLLTPLHLSTLKRHPHCVQWLLQFGADVECKDHLGDTPLHKAARTGNSECASLLIAQGASPDTLNYSGMTPAYLAEHNGHVECASHIRNYQCILASRLPSLPLTMTNGHCGSTGMDCDMDTSEMPVQNHEPAQAASNGFHPMAAAWAGSQNGFHGDQGPPLNGCNGMQEDGAMMGTMTGFKRGREEEEACCQKRPCTEARFEGNNNNMVMLSSSSVMDHQSSLAASWSYDRLVCDALGYRPTS